ncbi:hypothetical protein OG259_27055 [Streptomyces sp. NBC_00250]|uniref:hypothetical protein n=1 Tax=Streptomyces sp. NBC_00250 TaxID=2903641 RepID=UPI002E2B9DC9|nr:hypothetical protein [Streptomyces sp. NBC_00250]
MPLVLRRFVRATENHASGRRDLRIRPDGGSRPRRHDDRPPAWPGVLCGLGTPAALWGAMTGDAPGVRVFTLGTLLALAGLPPEAYGERTARTEALRRMSFGGGRRVARRPVHAPRGAARGLTKHGPDHSHHPRTDTFRSRNPE